MFNHNDRRSSNSLPHHLGFALNLVMVPLSAELTYVVEELENTKPGIFGPSGAYGQMFAIYTITLALAIIFGPDAAGYLQNNYGWGVTTMSMGIACASGVLPVVSCFEICEFRIDEFRCCLLGA